MTTMYMCPHASYRLEKYPPSRCQCVNLHQKIQHTDCVIYTDAQYHYGERIYGWDARVRTFAAYLAMPWRTMGKMYHRRNPMRILYSSTCCKQNKKRSLRKRESVRRKLFTD
jgi:hypothetical protein